MFSAGSARFALPQKRSPVGFDLGRSDGAHIRRHLLAEGAFDEHHARQQLGGKTLPRGRFENPARELGGGRPADSERLVEALREVAHLIVPRRLGSDRGRNGKRRPFDATVASQQNHCGTGNRRERQHRHLRPDQHRNTCQRLSNPCAQTSAYGVSNNTVLHVLDPPRLRHSICTASLNEPQPSQRGGVKLLLRCNVTAKSEEALTGEVTGHGHSTYTIH